MSEFKNQSAFSFLRNRKNDLTKDNESIPNIISSLPKHDSTGLNDLFGTETSRCRRRIMRILSFLIVLFLLSFFLYWALFSRTQTIKTNKKSYYHKTQSKASYHKEKFSDINDKSEKNYESTVTQQYTNITIEKSKAAVDKPRHNTIKSFKFTEEKLYSFVEEIKASYQNSLAKESYARRVEKESLLSLVERIVFDAEEGLKLQNTDITFGKINKVLKLAKDLKLSLTRLDESKRVLNNDKASIERLLSDFSSKKDDIEKQEKVLQKDFEVINKQKEERKHLIEIISDLKIQIENANKNLHKNTEIKETLEIEKEVIKRNLHKRKNDLVYYQESLKKAKNDVIQTQKEIEQMKEDQSSNADSRLKLTERKQQISILPSIFDKNILKIDSKIRKLELNKKELNAVLKTMNTFNELLHSLKSEIDLYSKEVNSSESVTSSEDIEIQKSNKIKEREETIERIKKFQENAVSSLKSIFINKVENYDNLKDILVEEIQMIDKKLDELKKNLEDEKKKSYEIVTELKMIEKKLLMLTDDLPISTKEKFILSKNEEIEIVEQNIHSTEREIKLLTEKSTKHEILLQEQNEKYNGIKINLATIQGRLEKSEEDIRKVENEISIFIDNKKSIIIDFKLKNENLDGLAKRILEMSDKIKEEDKLVLSLTAQIKKYHSKLDKQLCFLEND